MLSGALIKRDVLGGVLMLAIGAAAAIKGREYGVGSLRKMGPGFLPVALGVILAGLGLLIVVTAARAPRPAVSLGIGEVAINSTDWRGVLCILAGMGGFIAVGGIAGLIPASLVCVFVAALGDRTASWRSATILAVCVTTAGTLIFHYGLGVRFPLLGAG